MLECGEGEGRCGEVGEVRVVGDVWGSTEGGVEKCAGVWGDVGKVRKSLGIGVREVGVGGVEVGGWRQGS